MSRGITCDIVGEPLWHFKRKNPTGMEVARYQAGPRHSASGAATPTRVIEKAPRQISHVIWVPSLFLGIQKTAEFQRSDFKT